MMNKKHDNNGSRMQARADSENPHALDSTDASPNYLAYNHPDNWFVVDLPAHWRVVKTDDGTVEFSAPDAAGRAGIMFFRVSLPVDAAQIEASGHFEQLAMKLLSDVGSTNIRRDPTIIYTNYTADRPEEGQAGQRWFVLAADMMLGISTNCSLELNETYQPLFERILSSLRVKEGDEQLAPRVIDRIRGAIVAALPTATIEIAGLNVKTDKFEISIGNLLVQVKRNPKQFDEIVDQFIRGTIGLSRGTETLGQETWEQARRRIQPLLKTNKYIQEANERMTRSDRDSDSAAFLISAPWLADVRICFAIDNKGTFRFINSHDMHRWNLSLEDLAQVSMENLEALPEPDLTVMTANDAEPFVGGLRPKAGAASSYLLHPNLYPIVRKQISGEIAAAIPDRDALIFFEYRGQQAVLLNAVSHHFQTAGHPISDRLFQVTPDGIALL